MHSVESITSKEEAMAKVGATFRSQYVDFGANFGFDFDKEQNHILAKFIQKQYTVTTDFPKTPTIFTSIKSIPHRPISTSLRKQLDLWSYDFLEC